MAALRRVQNAFNPFQSFSIISIFSHIVLAIALPWPCHCIAIAQHLEPALYDAWSTKLTIASLAQGM